MMYEPPKNQSNFDDVGDFHTKFALPSVTEKGAYPRHPSRELLEMRMKFLLEELLEFVEAAGYAVDVNPENQLNFERVTERADHEGMFDALIDLVYVALGTSHILGYPWQNGWKRVQAANMAKVRAKPDGSDSLRKSSFDVVKPPGWIAPDLGELLEACGWNLE